MALSKPAGEGHPQLIISVRERIYERAKKCLALTPPPRPPGLYSALERRGQPVPLPSALSEVLLSCANRGAYPAAAGGGAADG